MNYAVGSTWRYLAGPFLQADEWLLSAGFKTKHSDYYSSVCVFFMPTTRYKINKETHTRILYW